jgi:radical SAM-linked protein
MMIRQRVRIRFCKQGDLRLISHKDLLRTMERLFRRAGLSLSMSEGFHPKPRMSFPSALAVGIAGDDEVMELELSLETTAEAVRAALEPHLPPGMTIKQIDVLPEGARKGAVSSVTFEVRLPAERLTDTARHLEALLDSSEYIVEREEGKGPVDLRPYIEELILADDVLRMRLRVTPLGSARPREVLEALRLEDVESLGFQLARTKVELA